MDKELLVNPELKTYLNRNGICIMVLSKFSKYVSVIQQVNAHLRKEYQLVWVVFPSLKMVKVFTSPRNGITFSENDLIPASPVLNDLQITDNELFKNYNQWPK